jgi:Uma2 family endonuclease
MEREVSTQPRIRVTPEEYLALERAAETRSEYVDGEIFPMSGGSFEHDRIIVNLIIELGTQLRDRPASVHGPQLSVKTIRTGSYFYPDISVTVGDPDLEDEHMDNLLNPHVVVEVLSASTESYDRGLKFAHYRTMDSIREYVLVTQTEYRVERYLRQDDGNWLYSEVTDPQGSLELSCVACRIPLSSVYRNVDFERAKRRQR